VTANGGKSITNDLVKGDGITRFQWLWEEKNFEGYRVNPGKKVHSDTSLYSCAGDIGVACRAEKKGGT